MTAVHFVCVNSKHEIKNEIYVDGLRSFLIDRGLASAIDVFSDEEDIYWNLKFQYLDVDTNKELTIEIGMEFATYESCTQLSVIVDTDLSLLSPQMHYIEDLKFAIKEKVKDDWQTIEWLFDKDSQCLSEALYPCVFKTENLLRQLITELMTRKYGLSWWTCFVSHDIKAKHSQRYAGYKQSVPGFANIDERLMSIDIGDLLSIITYKHSQWNPAFDDHINAMLNGLEMWKPDAVREKLQSQMVVQNDFWQDVFSQFLPEQFPDLIKIFDKNRNHVAHNKLLDRQAFNSIRKNTEDVMRTAEKALIEIEKQLKSSEIRALEEREQEEEKAGWEATYEEIMESEAGVEIRCKGEIEEIFDDAFAQIGTAVEEALRFRSDIEVVAKHSIIEFTSRITENTIKIACEQHIDSSPGAESILSLAAIAEQFKTEIVFINGEADFDEEQACYIPITEDELNGVDSATNEIVEFINIVFPNLRAKVDAEKYRIMKDGGNPAVLDDYPCDECGECYIAADDRYAENGVCLNCGTKHDVHVCCRCGNHFVGYVVDGEPELCENCKEKLEQE